MPQAIATSSKYDLQWDSYSQWTPNEDTEVGGIYTDTVHFYALDDYHYEVTFRVGQNRQLGLLFAEVSLHYPDNFGTNTLNYCFGQFYTNKGAKLFAQFALNHFIETEKWSVCPSFINVDYIDGAPHTLGGDEIISEII